VVRQVSPAQSTKEPEMKNRIAALCCWALCLSICLVLSNKLLAQTPAQKLQQLSQVLSLSPQQKGELLPILEQEGPKLEAIKNNPNMSGREKAMQLRAIHQQTDPQVKGILSAQQYQEWKNIRQHEVEQAIQKKAEGPE
jgi:hypothetical protein